MILLSILKDNPFPLFVEEVLNCIADDHEKNFPNFCCVLFEPQYLNSKGLPKYLYAKGHLRQEAASVGF